MLQPLILLSVLSYMSKLSLLERAPSYGGRRRGIWQSSTGLPDCGYSQVGDAADHLEDWKGESRSIGRLGIREAAGGRRVGVRKRRRGDKAAATTTATIG
jgi:hypothetical protein